MAESQRSAFRANMAQLVAAVQSGNNENAKSAVQGLASLVFHDLDRVADALERIAEAVERRGPDLHARMGPRP